MGGHRKSGIWFVIVLFNFQNVLEVPYIKQERYFCAASCLAMVMLYWGEDTTQYEIAEKTGWSDNRGVTIQKLTTFLETLPQYSYKMGSGHIDQLREWLRSGYPIIVGLRGAAFDIKHAVVLIGFDEKGFFYHDPSQGEKLKIPYARFIIDWASSYCFFCIIIPYTSEVNLEINSNPNTGRDI